MQSADASRVGNHRISVRSGKCMYEKVSFLGQGGFGSVYLVTSHSESEPEKLHKSAMKVIPKKKFPSELLVESLRLEK